MGSSSESSNGKLNAAKKAVELVENGMVIGIGSGSTVEAFLRELGEKIDSEGINVIGVPSSYGSHMIAVDCGIVVSDLYQYPQPEIYIDGADQIDSQFNCVKGGGGALTREKILASSCTKFAVITDSSKLGEKLDVAVPVEVIPFVYGSFKIKVTELGGKSELRESKRKFGPVITDNGNFVADCDFGTIDDPQKLEKDLNNIPGVLENGIFSKELVSSVIVGKEDGVELIK
ncbi:MAG: ribose-5-phosphate isomerase RpiA [Archaeoglobaceae archaeon]